jgi:hypothetical protein
VRMAAATLRRRSSARQISWTEPGTATAPSVSRGWLDELLVSSGVDSLMAEHGTRWIIGDHPTWDLDC